MQIKPAVLRAAFQPFSLSVLASARAILLYEKLLTIPGIGRILGMTITMEVGEVKRFKTDGDFASYVDTLLKPKKTKT